MISNLLEKFFCTIFKKKLENGTKKNFFSLTLRAKPLHFYLKNLFFFSFFLTKNVILLVHLNRFPQYFLFICENMSLPSWFWKDPCTVFYLISLVNENNDHFCIFIVKKCHFLVFLMHFFASNSGHFPMVLV